MFTSPHIECKRNNVNSGGALPPKGPPSGSPGNANHAGMDTQHSKPHKLLPAAFLLNHKNWLNSNCLSMVLKTARRGYIIQLPWVVIISFFIVSKVNTLFWI